MYSGKVKNYILFGLIISFGLYGYTFGFDLVGEIQGRFQPDYNNSSLSDEYLSLPYDGNFSKDPFLDAMSVYTGMLAKTKVTGVKYVENALLLNGCSLSKGKQWSILYYFVPEFRGEIARIMKIDGGDYASKNYTFDEDIIMDYCIEFYNCIANKPGVDVGNGAKKITSGTPENIKTNCKEFFQTNYREGQAEEKRVQNLEISWLGNDKYLNATTEESPYDVMTDLGVVGELSYLQSQYPITPVFYDLPVFAKYKEILENSKNGGGNDCVEETYGGVVEPIEEISLGGSSKSLERMIILDEGVSLGGNTKVGEDNLLGEVSLGGTDNVLELTFWLDKQNDGGGDVNNLKSDVSLDRAQVLGEIAGDSVMNLQASDGSINPLSPKKFFIKRGYDELVEGLGGYRLNEDKSTYYGSLCEDEEGEIEYAEDVYSESVQKEQGPVTRDDGIGTEEFDLIKAEYQELVDYMVEAATSYSSLSEDKAKEVEKKAGDVGRYDGATTSEQVDGVVNKILKCYQSCVGLSVDGQLTCMMKCSCGEITSDIFNPEVNPGMGPIYTVRFCAVPAVNPRYFYGGSDGTEGWTSTLGGGASNGGRGNTWGGISGGGNSGGGNSGGGSSGGGNSGGGNSGGGNGGGGSNGGGNGGGGSNGGSTCSNGGNPNAREEIGISFNVGGTRMVSMEKGTSEILGALEELDRGGRLGMWTQQYNFLDSSTKMMDIRDTASFTISANKKSLGQKVGEPTDEYMKRYMKNKDNNWLIVNHVANPLDNPATRNYYLLVGYEGEGVGDVSASVNANATRQSQGYLNVAPGFIVDQSENSNTARYADISELFSNWLDEQGDFWAKKVDYLREMDKYAQSLYAKKG